MRTFRFLSQHTWDIIKGDEILAETNKKISMSGILFYIITIKSVEKY